MEDQSFGRITSFMITDIGVLGVTDYKNPLSDFQNPRWPVQYSGLEYESVIEISKFKMADLIRSTRILKKSQIL